MRKLGDEALEAELMKMKQELEMIKNKEEYARKTLIESQAKWTNFCRGILQISKSLIELHSVAPQLRSEGLKDAVEKVSKYEQILVLNEEDLKDIEVKYKEIFNAPEPYQAQRPSHLNSISDVEESQALSIVLPIVPGVQFGKVKEFLLMATDDLKICAVLQALCWRMTRARHGEPRKEIMQTYINQDLLGCNIPEAALLKRLICHKNRKY